MQTRFRIFPAKGMNGRKTSEAATYVATFPTGSWTFTAPLAGFYKFVGWAGGGNFDAGVAGASAGYFEKTIRLVKNQSIALVVGGREQSTTVTDPLGNVITATGGTSLAAGSATGGDVNLSGSMGGVAGLGTGGGASSGTLPGGGAPANLPYRGAAGGNAVAPPASGPGAGGGGSGSGAGGPGMGGQGLIVASLVRF